MYVLGKAWNCDGVLRCQHRLGDVGRHSMSVKGRKAVESGAHWGRM